MDAGRCESVLEGHKGTVTSLAACGRWLARGSCDMTVRVWGMEGEAAAWRCERTLDGQGSDVLCVASWEGYVASGSRDGRIRVWAAETWGLEQALRGHRGCVLALAVSGRRLISASADRTLRVWSAATWGCVRTVEVSAGGSPLYINTLAVSGSRLVGGTCSAPFTGKFFASEPNVLRVWDAETLEPLHTLGLPDGKALRALLQDRGEVWGAAGKHAVVWGRRW